MKDELLFNVNLVGDPSVGVWYMALSLYGDWHGISEEDWSLLARRIPGRVLKADENRYVICRPTKEGCDNFAGFEAEPGVRQLVMTWGEDPEHPERPPAWFCPRG